MATSRTSASGLGVRKTNWEYGIDFALNTGDNIPAIGLGTWKIPPSEIENTIKNAVELGYRHFDFSTPDDRTCEAPGGAFLGEYLHHPKYGRTQFFLSSKLHSKCWERHAIFDNVEKLIHELRCYHLDLLLLQFPCEQQSGGKQFSLQESWKALETLVKDGKVRAIGVTNFNLEQLKTLCGFCEIVPSVYQLEYHPYNQGKEEELINFCHKLGIHISCASPFGSDEGCPRLMNDQMLVNLGKKYNKTPTQIIIRWNIQNQRSVIPRTSNLTHLKENLLVFDFELKDEDMKSICSLNKGERFVAPEKFAGTGRKEEAHRIHTGVVGTR